MLDTVATIIGYGFMLFGIVIAVMLVAEQVRYCNDEDFFTLTFFRIGVVYTKTDTAFENMKKVRPSVKKRLQLSMPMWFNKHVWNIGGSE
ncbi:MAG: hypothetical protein DRQ58_10900 [Gammaproteobacteria bacterium]|nr:MAG: hypothetical protein DRQ58_10900 [Gammaproteobacteria bacterium]